MLKSGQVYAKFREMAQAQGGDVTVLDECQENQAKFTHDIMAPQYGFVADMDALAMGLACVKLGAGRTNANDGVDASAGIFLHIKVGEPCVQGAKVATLYTNISQAILAQVAETVERTIQYADTAVDVPPVISYRVSKGGNIEAFAIPSQLKNL